MVSPSVSLLAPVETTKPDDTSSRPDDESTLEKERPSKPPFLEVKIPQPGELVPKRLTAEEFSAISKKLKSFRIKP